MEAGAMFDDYDDDDNGDWIAVIWQYARQTGPCKRY
jgi:hypothetical protein